MESRKISLLKAISYRIICIISMLIVTFALTRNVNQSIYITVVFQAIQTILYYLHERLWIRLIPRFTGNRKQSSAPNDLQDRPERMEQP